MKIKPVKIVSKHKLLKQLTVFHGILMIIAILSSSILVVHLCTEKAIHDIIDQSMQVMDIQLDSTKSVLQRINESMFVKYTETAFIQQIRTLQYSVERADRIIQENIMREMLSGMLADENSLYGVTVMDQSGRTVHAYRTGFQEGNLLDQVLSEYQEEILSNKGAVYYEAVGSGVVFARMIYSTLTLEHVGSIAFYFDADALARKCKLNSDSDIPENWALVTGDGKVLLEETNTPGIWEDVLQYPMTDREISLNTEIRFADKPYILLGQTDSAGMLSLYNVSRREIFYVGWHSLLLSILAVSIATVFLLFLFSTAQSIELTQKINLLLEKIMQISTRKFDQTLYFHREDELGVLACQLNRLGHEMDELIKENKKNEQLRYEMLHAKYCMLQANLHPHLINNFLEIISSLAMLHDVPEISKSVRQFADFLRSNIRQSNQTTVKLQKEIQQVDQYVRIYQSIYPRRISVNYQVDAGLGDMCVPSFILQPLVENAIVHGAEQTQRLVQVVLRGYLDKDAVVLEVEDNSVGISDADVIKIRSAIYDDSSDDTDSNAACFGLKSIHTLINLKYGAPYGVSIDSRIGQWTLVRLTMPLPKNRLNPKNRQ